MKLSTKKKIILLASVAAFAILLSGCSVPTTTDAEGNRIVKQITIDTTFHDTMDSENWFSAILVWPMAQMLNHLAPHVGVIGAIALLTILINLILLVFTLKSQVATQQMQLMQPELEKIQRKYEGRDDDASKMKQAQEMQKLYGKYHINPLSTILITFIQFPIIIAMYQAVQRASAIKTGTVGGLSLEPTILNGLRSGQFGYLVIFIIMAACQFVSMSLPQWLSKKKAEEEAEKHHKRPVESANSKQTKIMQYYMFAMILIFGLMWPAAMSVYWAIYSLVTIFKTLLVQKIIDKQNSKEEVAK